MKFLFQVGLLIGGLGLIVAEPVRADLFASNEPLALTLEAPFGSINRQRNDQAKYSDATVHYTDASGDQKLPVRIKTRGRFRLLRNNCTQPPLRLNFKSEDVAGTLFDGEDKLKLVLPCRKRQDYRDYVQLEYMSYRLLNQLSDISFRARPLQLRLIDTGNDKVVETVGFVIESKQSVAARNGLELVEIDRVPSNGLVRDQAGKVSFFQYLIGNTDFSLLAGDGSECCHNSIPMRRGNLYLTVPYDFDWAGLVDAPYAKPNERLPIRDVRQRVYRGICVSPAFTDELVDLFNGQRAAMDALWDEIPVSDRERVGARKFYDKFWPILNDRRRLDKALARANRRCSN